MGLRQFLLVTHRWLGLASSLLLTIAGLTGALLVWPDAIPARPFIGLSDEDRGNVLETIDEWLQRAAGSPE